MSHRAARTSTTAAAMLGTYRPALVPLTANLTGLVFPLMKVYPAECALRAAAADGLIDDRSLIVETSSGTMALALAIVCNLQRRRLAIVTDPACDSSLCARLRDLGAAVEVVSGPAGCGGYQRARLDRLHEICDREANHWWLHQYDNPANAAAYHPIADHVAGAIDSVDCIVGPVGSGGSMCGLVRALRSRNADLQAIAVDTFGSVLFGLPDAPRTLRGLGNSLVPGNLDHTLFDEIHWVTAAAAYTATRRLHQATALFRGGTSGAAFLVARHWAETHPTQHVVCVFPDDGWRYLATVYDDAYLRCHDLWLADLPGAPSDTTTLDPGRTQWTRMVWNRRRLAEVRGEDVGPAALEPSPVLLRR